MKTEKPFLELQKRPFHIVISTILPCESGFFTKLSALFYSEKRSCFRCYVSVIDV